VSTTHTFVLIGHPVGHSVSPAIHQAAYRELGLSDCRYVALDCPDRASVERQIDALRRGEIRGANVTVPWKRVALELSDEKDASARDTGAANVLHRSTEGSNRVTSHNTDVLALADELARGRTRALSKATAPAPGEASCALVIGNGGAALAAVTACRAIGVGRVVVVARRFRGSDPQRWEGADEFRKLGAVPVAWPDVAHSAPFHEAASASDLVVQTTSDGMRGASDGRSVRDVVPWASLRRSVFVYDVVYNPSVTPFVEAARAHGLSAETGLGMLVGQAASAIELWLGQRPPLEPLRRAAEDALARKTHE
jgi:shikimate dehydrogenase